MAIEAGTSTYYQAKRGIVQDGLQLLLDAGVKDSYVSGDTWYDLSGKNNNATLYNTPTYTKLNGGALGFNGTNEYGKVIGGFMYSQMTWALWIYKQSSNYRTLVSQAATNGFRGDIGFYPSKVISQMYSYPQGYRNIYSDNILSNGQYYYIVMTTNTSDANSRKMYINGVQQVGTISIQYSQPTGDLWIAARGYAGPTAHFGGRIYQFAVHNIELSAQQVLDNYNATRHRFGL